MWGSRHIELSEVKYKNLTIELTGYTDSEELGLAPREKGILGVSQLTIPPKYLKGFFKNCSTIQDFEDLDGLFDCMKAKSPYQTYNSDVIIHFFHWALEYRVREVKVEMEINHFYWLCHDLVHAEEHTHGCDLQVGGSLEKYTYLEAFNKAEEISQKVYKLSLLKESEAEELIKSYNARFRGHTPLPWDFFKDYTIIEPEEIFEDD